MSNESRPIDPPEILAIKRAFGKLPSKLTYKDGVIRFKYLRPIDIFPGVMGIGFLVLITIYFLSTRGLTGIGLSTTSLTIVFTYFYLRWLVPRLNTVAVLSKEGIGLERNGEISQFHKWIQISRMTVGLNATSPIYLWTSTALLGKVPALFTTFSTTPSDYHVLQATILTAFAGESAPLFKDHVSEFELAGKFKWFRLAFPFLALAICIALTLAQVTIGNMRFYTLAYVFGPLIPIFSIWILSSLIEWNNYVNGKKHIKNLSIISIGNSTLSYDLKDDFRNKLNSRKSYRFTNDKSSLNFNNPTVASVLASLVLLAVGLAMALPIVTLLLRRTGDSINMPQLLVAIGMPAFLGFAGFLAIKIELMIRRDRDVVLQFDEKEGFVVDEGKVIPISCFGSSRMSYADFVENPSSIKGVLKIIAGGKTYYFSPINMVSISDHELMNHLPEFD